MELILRKLDIMVSFFFFSVLNDSESVLEGKGLNQEASEAILENSACVS